MTVLELQRVSKTFGGIVAARDVSMGFKQGQVTGLIGPNGAGKTTLFNIICGFVTVDSGRVLLRGRDITGRRPWQVSRAGVGRLFQDVHLFRRMTVLDNVMTAFQGQAGENPLKSLFGRWVVRREEAKHAARARELLDFVGLADKADELAEGLSYGQQKLLSIARLLAADAEVMLLDEPTAGVNPRMIDTLLDVIRALAREGRTIVFIEHNMNVVVEIADFLFFLDGGQVESVGTPREVLGDPEVRKAYIGI